MYTCEVVLKTVQETGESGGIIGKLGEFGGNSGKNWGEIGKLCFPNGETEFPDEQINFPHIGENEGKLFHKNFHLGNLCEIAGENEREMKGNFCFHNHFQ